MTSSGFSVRTSEQRAIASRVERPIIFCGEMVRAILAGKKTQTRRLIRWPGWCLEHGEPAVGVLYHLGTSPGAAMYEDGQPRHRFCAPYREGDRLWVREAWAPCDRLVDGYEKEEPVSIAYRADRKAICHEHDNRHDLDTSGWGWDSMRWRPSIHMPRWSARIFLDVSKVWVERLQAIREADARAEGVDTLDGSLGELTLLGRAKKMRELATESRVWFAEFWDQINGKRASWNSNPWVWVVSFGVAHA